MMIQIHRVQAIKQAIEGGYSYNGVIRDFTKNNKQMATASFRMSNELMLDPLFWQALGKGFDWVNIFGTAIKNIRKLSVRIENFVNMLVGEIGKMSRKSGSMALVLLLCADTEVEGWDQLDCVKCGKRCDNILPG